MSVYRVTISASGPVTVPFPARAILVSNPTGQWVYAALGSTLAPSTTNPDLVVAPFTYIQQPIAPNTQFAFAVGTKFAPTATAQGATVQITFFDTEQPSLVANINLPNVAYAPAWIFFYALDLTAGATVALLTPSANQSIIVYEIATVYDNATQAAIQFHFFQGTTWAGSTKVWSAYLWNLAYTKRDTDIASWLPHGFALPPGVPLSIKNGDGANEVFPNVGIFYQLK
jgi:hypothetical protein